MSDHWFRDLRHAARGLRARPAYALVSVVTLTLVIGAASAVIAVVNATTIRPLPFRDADRIVQVAELPPGRTDVASRTPLDIRVFVRFGESLRLVDAFEGFWARDRALGGDAADPESVTAGGASPGAFTLFHGIPLIGRTFTIEEDRANAKVAVLSEGLWRRRFGGDARAIGRIVSIDREPHVVIGVMPAAFQMAYTPMDLWTPLNASEAGFTTAATLMQAYGQYFKTMRIPFVTGRDFTDAETFEARGVAIVSRKFAEQFRPGEDPIGQGLRRGVNRPSGPLSASSRMSATAASPRRRLRRCISASRRTTWPSPRCLLSWGRRAIRSASPWRRGRPCRRADPAQPIDHVTTLDQYMADSLGPQRFRSTLLLLLAALGLVLEAVGIYGLTARAVSERQRELGVRLALGATSGRVAVLVVWQAVRAVGVGLAAGVALSIAASSALVRTLPNLDRAEPWSAVPATMLLLVVAIVAAAIPARRAVSLDPTAALKAE